VLFHSRANDFVPIKSKNRLKPEQGREIEDPLGDDTDWCDIAVFELDNSQYEMDAFGDEPPLVLPTVDTIWTPQLGSYFILRGFPSQLTGADYIRKTLKVGAIQLEADLVGEALMRECFEIKFRDISQISDLDGMSGTPIFWLGGGEPRSYRFAGMMIRGTHSSGTGYFLGAHVIAAVLDRISPN